MILRNRLKSQSFVKSVLTDTRPAQLTFRDLIGEGSNVASTSSFKYEPLDSPLKSTQQLNVEWANFEDHTFFSSAEVKVNVAFDQIINGFPFDGSKAEIEDYLEKLTGFERWVLNSFPKFAGQLHFSGTQVGEDPSNGYLEKLGTRIEVRDSAGWLYPDISKNDSGAPVMNPQADKSFTIEAQVFLPDQANDRQVLVQKLSTDKKQGFTFHLEPSATSEVVGAFSIVSGGVNNFISCSLKKGEFNHLCISLNREVDNVLQAYVNEKLQNESRKKNAIGTFTENPDLIIGSGSSFYFNGVYTTPTQTFSGVLDEFRVFHSARSVQQQKAYSSKGLYASDSLKLYFRFNEPSASLSNNPSDMVNMITLDSSGNSLHGIAYNISSSFRQSALEDPKSPMRYERDEFKLVLFPQHPDVVSLNTKLLASASYYDQINPNLITKLIPRHYLREGAEEEGFSRTAIEGSTGAGYSYTSDGVPGQGKMGSAQIILTFLYIWAKFFDDIKMFVDAFKTIRTVDYSLPDTSPNNFLSDIANSHGLFLPPFFNDSSVFQYAEGDNVVGSALGSQTLKEIQSHLLRRVLVNMPDILKSKGTQHSIKSFLRSVGIDPDNSVRIREFGGPSMSQFGSSRENKTKFAAVVDFASASLVTTPFLSASRVEAGYPEATGPFAGGVSTNSSDGLLTSGSWTFEACYKYAPKNVAKMESDVQSLVRFEVTGSATSAKPGVVLNLIASGSPSSLYAFVRPGTSSTSPVLQLTVPANVMNGERWNVSVGCDRSDSIASAVSSSYFLRAAAQNAGDITRSYATSSFFYETPSGENNAFRVISSSTNASGSRIAIGKNPNIPEGGMGYLYLNSTLDAGSEARETEFVGQVSNVRFWSKGLTEGEWREHVKNPNSLGVNDPLTNYNYVTNKSGSFERLRLATLEKQTAVTASSLGTMTFVDFSENGFHAEGSGFSPNQRIFIGDVFGYSYISPYFDEYSSTEKIRIRGFKSEEYLQDAPYAVLGPAYETPAGETPQDDVRFSIEMSLIDSLNNDIVNMFASLDTMANAIGAPELMYSPDYPDLEKLREVYFNRLKEKLNFRNFFEFYRWFDLSMSKFIDQLIPRKTKFKGANFVIESHMLERHKMQYYSNEMYLGDSMRGNIRDTLLVQQVVGKISRY